MSLQVQLPEEVNVLINAVAEENGYWLGKSALLAEAARMTAREKAMARKVKEALRERVREYMRNGTDVREDIKDLRHKLRQIRKEIRKKGGPLYKQASKLNAAIKYIKLFEVIPMVEKVTGVKLTPRLEVSERISKALELLRKK